ncbi:hypothetical protein TNCT_76831 [Trichonephila clavata]|uniref:Uncharacterized protein n=1 Tax=Trichonephila clavata TaxID=2740835 RepID=A0A8X6KNT6_TRICU|nr:hypothetical protein TNCT_76831 [Trichonephila clavata]
MGEPGNRWDHVWEEKHPATGDQTRRDEGRDRKKAAEARKPETKKTWSEEQRLAGRWILQSVDIFLIYSFL